MRRLAEENLEKWLHSPTRKPLILRGARQVGKSTLVRLFAKNHQLDLIEINLETTQLTALYSKEFIIQELLDEIQLKSKKQITKKTLLFLDEIQESPRLLKLLRYFYELHPEINVIAAGSLLELALKAENFSFPVGRVQFCYLGPMSFREFLWATENQQLDKKLGQFDFSSSVHELALSLLKKYYYVGGMPECVKYFSQTNSLVHVRDIQEQLIQTYQADFPKYYKNLNTDRINRIFLSLPSFIGKKIIYTKLDENSSSRDIRKSLELLIDARVIVRCNHSNANLVPLDGEVDTRIFKTYFLDVGLYNAMTKLNIESLSEDFLKKRSTQGMIAEQYVAQHLNQSFFHSPRLFYHLRDKGIQKAEIDFLIESAQDIIPVEVKSSQVGHLKSLKTFSESKKSKVGIKTSLQPFKKIDSFTQGGTILYNIPLYAIDYLRNFLKSIK